MSICVFQCDIHMVKTLRMLELNIDKKDDDELSILKQPIFRSVRPK